MHKYSVALFALFLFTSPAFAQVGVTSYKLGNVYHSEQDEDVKCLEGSMGFVMQTKECHGKTAGKCTSDAECQKEGGSKYYYCSKKCEYQECYGADSLRSHPCVQQYSHMYSCVDNENGDGGHHCAVTCTWEMVKEASGMTDKDLARLKLEMEVWKKPTQALTLYKSLNFDKNNPGSNYLGTTYNYKFMTCKLGKVADCQPVKNASTSVMWNTAPCIPCSIISGGDYAIDDPVGLEGDMPYYQYNYNTVLSNFSVSSNQYISGDETGRSLMPYGCGTFTQPATVSFDAILQGDFIGDYSSKLHANFQTVADTQKSLFSVSHKDLEPYLGDPEFYYLGAMPICSTYWMSKRRTLSANDETVHLIYIPAQEVVSAQRKRGTSGVQAATPWDLRDRDRLACCATSMYKSTISGGRAMNCIELDASNPDVYDLE